jgi:hypothetical protein
LAFRLNAVGGAALYAQMFRDRDIRAIIRESKGVPAAIEALAHQRLLRFVARKHPMAAPPDAPRLTGIVRIAIATLFGVALVLTFVFQDELTLAFGTYQMRTQPVTHDIAAAPDNAAPPEAPLAQVETDPIAEVVTIMESSPAQATSPLPVDTPVAEQDVAPARPEQAPVAAATNDVPGPEVPPVPPYPQAWLLEQNPAAYTVQIVGSPAEDDVRRALKRYDFAEVRATFTARKKDQDWYGLVVGIYPDMESAQQARVALPDTLAKRAWVRRVRTIQGEIKPLDTAPEGAPVAQEATATGN